jgi:hypothetical protein
VAGKAHHADPGFRLARSVLIPQAYADPHHRCPTCGRTLAEVQAANPTARWDCDHVVAGSSIGGYRARCSPCNRADGARMVNAKRASGYDW